MTIQERSQYACAHMYLVLHAERKQAPVCTSYNPPNKLPQDELLQESVDFRELTLEIHPGYVWDIAVANQNGLW